MLTKQLHRKNRPAYLANNLYLNKFFLLFILKKYLFQMIRFEQNPPPILIFTAERLHFKTKNKYTL